MTPHPSLEDPIGFAVRLRAQCARHGLAAPTGAAVDLTQALVALERPGPAGCYYAARAVFVHAPEQRKAFDAAFGAAFADEFDADLDAREPTFELPTPREGPTEGPDGAEGIVGPAAFSARERLGSRDIASLSAEELALVQSMIASLGAVSARQRRSRRASPTRAVGVIDLRRSARSILLQDRFPGGPRYRKRLERPRRTIALVDVSGSMSRYVPVYARLVYRLVRAGVVSEAFTLGTRLTRVIGTFRCKDEAVALEALSTVVPDWSGGTRLGAMLERFNQHYGVRGLARGATVVVFSDGLDRGDPDLLGAQVRRLAFVAERIVWVNPLKGMAGYAPIQRAMAAALPFVEQLVAGHSLDALRELVELIADR